MSTASEGKLLAGLASGKTLTEAAAHAGISLSTAQRLRREPRFVRRLDAICEQQLDDELRQVSGLRTEAIARLRELVGSEDGRIALRAIDLLLTHTTRLETVKRYGQRLAALEELVRVEELEETIPPEEPDLESPPPPRTSSAAKATKSAAPAAQRNATPADGAPDQPHDRSGKSRSSDGRERNRQPRPRSS